MKLLLNPTQGRLLLEVPKIESKLEGITAKMMVNSSSTRVNGLKVIASHETSEIRPGDFVLINVPMNKDAKGNLTPEIGTQMTIDAKFKTDKGEVITQEVILTYEQFVEAYYSPDGK